MRNKEQRIIEKDRENQIEELEGCTFSPKINTKMYIIYKLLDQ